MTKARILVVEDDRIIAEDIALTLKDSGYEVVAIEGTAAGALTSAGHDKPDLVLMDIIIKGKMDGIEAAGVLRARYQIPVVYLTSHADEGTINRAKETAPFGYLIKPFGRRELEATIEIALYKHTMEMQRESLITELRDALARVETLEGILPICSFCKKIRDDKGYWQAVEAYITNHTKARFSHGLCQECANKHYPELYKVKKTRPSKSESLEK